MLQAKISEDTPVKTIYKDRVVYKDKIIYQDKVIYKNSPSKKSSSFVSIITIILSLILGFLLGGFFFYKFLSLNSDKHIAEIKELQEDNTKLKNTQATKTVQMPLKAKETQRCKELERTNNSLTETNTTMKENIKKLEAELRSLESDLTKETQTLQTELTQQSEYIESLKNELAKHETNSGASDFAFSEELE